MSIVCRLSASLVLTLLFCIGMERKLFKKIVIDVLMGLLIFAYFIHYILASYKSFSFVPNMFVL